MHDYVIRHGIATNIRTGKRSWFRLYKSGWVEQGGKFNCSTLAENNGTYYEADFPIKMVYPGFMDATIFSVEKGIIGGSADRPARLNYLSTDSMYSSGGNAEQIYGTHGMSAVCWKIAGKCENNRI